MSNRDARAEKIWRTAGCHIPKIIWNQQSKDMNMDTDNKCRKLVKISFPSKTINKKSIPPSVSFSSYTLPSEEFELTANTLRAHMTTHGKLVLKPLIYIVPHSELIR